MYAGRRGWFSESVERDLVHIWESEGGAIENTSHQADYLFSSDASHRDTQRIYNSLEYIENKATVFHASFLRLHTQLETKTMVTLGNFILPPPSIHKEIKMKIGNFLWEQDKSSHIQQVSKNIIPGYTSIDQLKKFSGELHDFIPDASEYCVLYVHGDCSDFSSIKTVHNKK
ncbi:telomere repeats-binding bouquet formation protein 2 [Dendrobates tinctorius]|uniref:telomere repeats-binding bouquet formation protein 2 n=1 Tax=Dendrobates tinctorius TaxID=92724 RepID=UPI003CCA0899